jgi:hypothetical protein
LRLTQLEAASHLLFGGAPDSGSLPPADGAIAPRQALEEVVLESLRAGACFVSFSGGRDSSAVLALASALARRHSLDNPVPVSLVFPDIPETREDSWQRLLIEHLGLREWERVTLHHELDYLGPVACEALRKHGHLYPANVHLHGPALERARGGTLLTGWGGDDVFANWRLARIAGALRARSRPRPADARRLAFWSLPRPVREALARRFGTLPVHWLTPAAHTRLYRDWARSFAGQPRRFDRWVGWLRRHRYVWATERSFDALAADAAARVVHPLIDPRFVSALAAHEGRLGPGDRTSAWRRLFGDLLPDALVSRPDKAYFGDVFLGPASRGFLENWHGEGLDPEVVDFAALTRALQQHNTAYRTGLLLQWVWLELGADVDAVADRW